jgi:hypothetical protein
MKRSGFLALGGVLLAIIGGWAAQNRSLDPELGTREAMRQKLSFSSRIMEGIATENYGLIQTNAQRLAQLSRVAGWRARQTPEYELFTNEFRRQAEALENAAAARNLDAATLAYVQMTFSCTSCHKYMRGSRVAWAR